MKKNVFMMFALLLAMGGAWAQSTPEPGILVPTGNANEWTLTMPADNMLLKVSYYDEYTLDSIPMGWQVKVGNAAPVHPTAYTEGNTTLGHLTISETDSVELIPPANVKPNVKSVTLVDNSTPPAPATVLGGALVDGAIIKVYFKWEGMNKGDYVQGVFNAASGSFTASKGGNYWGTYTGAVYKVEKSGDNIIIGAGYNNYNEEGMVWTFNTTNDTYTTTNGGIVNDYPGDFALISVTLNGTDITSQLTAQ